MARYDAVVIGAGPNGLAAAVTIARSGRSVLVIEGHPTVGGGSRTSELTLPGFHHDVCSAVHPMGIGSPFLRTLPLQDHGLRWVHPEAPLAHVISPHEAVFLRRSIAATAAELDLTDGAEYHRRIEPLVDQWDKIEPQVLGPPIRVPRHPGAVARFGLTGMLPGASLLKNFSGDRARALVAGCMAHSFLPLDRAFTSAFGLLLLVGAHKFGWPFAVGGSQAIADALASYLRSLGGEIETGRRVNSLGELPEAKVLMCDLTPRGLAALAGTRLSPRQHRRYQAFRHGPAAFKLDYALSRPVPWINRELSAAGTIHLGGRAEDVASAEAATWHGHLPQRLFILIAQPSLFDETRAPEGRHTLWAYAHVPHGSQIDSTALIESQIEELAPGFRESVLDRCVSTPADLEAYNPNLVGGDITGGAHTLKQLLFRPFPAINPYATPIAGVYLCSSSTPPGAGVHGMCGYWAARAALRNELR